MVALTFLREAGWSWVFVAKLIGRADLQRRLETTNFRPFVVSRGQIAANGRIAAPPRTAARRQAVAPHVRFVQGRTSHKRSATGAAPKQRERRRSTAPTKR